MALCAALTACEALPRSDSQEFECHDDPDDLGESHPRHAELQRGLEDAVARHRLPGAVLLVRDEAGVWSGAAGTADAELGAPMRTCQPTRIASITKLFVAAAALQLVEQGRLALDDSVADLLDPALIADLPNIELASPRQLLAHTSGIPDFVDAKLIIDLFNDPWRFWTQAEAIRLVAGRRALFAPGAGFSYSNTNYMLIGEALGRAGDAPLPGQLEARIFAPLGLRSTRYRPDVNDTTGVARGYFDLFGTGELLDSTQSYGVSTLGADGGIISTAGDLRRFVDALLREASLVSGASLAEMADFGATDRDPGWNLPAFDGYGLGLMRWRSPSGAVGFGHGGDDFGYQSHAYYFAEPDLTFVLLVNGSALMPAGDNLSARVDRARDELVELAL